MHDGDFCYNFKLAEIYATISLSLWFNSSQIYSNERYRPTKGAGSKSANHFVFIVVPGYYGGISVAYQHPNKITFSFSPTFVR